MDPNIRDVLLKDPAVQEAVRKAGADALANPEVQQQILKVCQEKFPELAVATKDKMVEWANDPEVQKQAYHYAGAAMGVAWQSVEQVAGLIEQGPAGVRVLAFIAGLASCANAVFVIVLSPFAFVSNVTHVYQIAFALTTMLFEAKPEWIERVGGLNSYQDMVIDKAKFLSEVFGRGIFYCFQGILWLYFSSITELSSFAVGLFFGFIGFLHICMHFGIMPQEVAQKMQSVRTMVSGQVAEFQTVPQKVPQAVESMAPKQGQAWAIPPLKDTDLEKGQGGLGLGQGIPKIEVVPPPVKAQPSAAASTAAAAPEKEPLLGSPSPVPAAASTAVAPSAPAGPSGKGPVPKPPTKQCCAVQ